MITTMRGATATIGSSGHRDGDGSGAEFAKMINAGLCSAYSKCQPKELPSTSPGRY